MHAYARSLLIIAMLGVILPMRAGTVGGAPKEDFLQLLRIDLRAKKAKIVAESLELTPRELEIFSAAYREYDTELSRLNVERINLLREYASKYASIDDDMARDYMTRSFGHLRRQLALLEKCSKRIERELSPAVAARFAQVEQQMLMLIDVQIAAELPLIPRTAVLE